MIIIIIHVLPLSIIHADLSENRRLLQQLSKVMSVACDWYISFQFVCFLHVSLVGTVVYRSYD